MDEKKEDVEVRFVDRCSTHDVAMVEVRDADGRTGTAVVEPADPDFPSERTLRFSKQPSGDGWHRATMVTRRGPPKVNSEAYRRGWERIFGNKTPQGEA
jgi:hypothetical protein